MAKQILPEEVWDEVYIRYAKNTFLSFKSLVLTSFQNGKEMDDEARLLMAHWSNIMLDFFLDLKELDILPKQSLEKYPSEHARHFVLSYVLGKFPPFDFATTNLNFDLRKSILEDCNNKRIKDLAQG
jgi:hypothetical protein